MILLEQYYLQSKFKKNIEGGEHCEILTFKIWFWLFCTFIWISWSKSWCCSVRRTLAWDVADGSSFFSSSIQVFSFLSPLIIKMRCYIYRIWCKKRPSHALSISDEKATLNYLAKISANSSTFSTLTWKIMSLEYTLNIASRCFPEQSQLERIIFSYYSAAFCIDTATVARSDPLIAYGSPFALKSLNLAGTPPRPRAHSSEPRSSYRSKPRRAPASSDSRCWWSAVSAALPRHGCCCWRRRHKW